MQRRGSRIEIFGSVLHFLSLPVATARFLSKFWSERATWRGPGADVIPPMPPPGGGRNRRLCSHGLPVALGSSGASTRPCVLGGSTKSGSDNGGGGRIGFGSSAREPLPW